MFSNNSESLLNIWFKSTFKKMGDITEETSERNLSNDIDLVLSVSKSLGVVPQKEVFSRRVIAGTDKSNYKILYKKQFAYNPSRINIGSIGMLENSNRGIISPIYTIFKVRENIVIPEYLKFFLESISFRALVKNKIEVSVRSILKYKNFKEIELKIPSLQYQQKIVSFFLLVQKNIDLYKKSKLQWKLLIKNFNEKTFEKNKNVNEYYVLHGELNKYFNKFSGLSGITLSNFKQIGKKYLPYKKIYGKKICNENDLLDVNFESTNQNLIMRNDILITLSSETQDEVGISSLYNSDHLAYLNSFCFGIRLKEEFKNKIYPKYVNLILSLSEYRKLIFKLSNGTTRFNLSPNLFSKLIVKIPNWESQILISNMFYKIIKIIETQTRIIQKIEILKKYFLDKCFKINQKT